MNLHESHTAWKQHRAKLEADYGIFLPGVVGYATDELKRDYTLAMDAQPALTTSLNAGVPAMLTTYIDPQVVEILFAPVQAAKIVSEKKTGDWTTDTAMFPVVEHTGEVTSYGDFNQTGSTGVNTNFPQRQSYHYQTMKRWGEREMERMGLARINWVSEIDKAAATTLLRYQNYTYFFGVAGLQNYGLLNDPNLLASITPGVKSSGNGNVWVTVGNVINATANEVYADIQSLFIQLVAQTAGLVNEETKLTLALSPVSSVALTATNSFNVNVKDLLKKNFPNIRFETAVQYGVRSTQNPEGIAGGNFAQLIADELEGVETAFVAFTEKQRAHKIIPDTSSFKQKITQGSWGCIIRRPVAIASMLGL